MTKKKTEKDLKNKDVKNEEKKQEKVLTLEEKYQDLLAENAELKDKWVRNAAEFENFRRRTISEKSDWIKNATERIVLELCDVVDNFERALHPDAEKNRESYEKGIDLIFQQLDGVLKKEGVKKIEALGEEFDPQFHEALAHIPSELKDNKIAAVIQNGYTMNSKVIRPARVAVSNGEAPAETKKEKKKKNKV
ncbi:MAG: nucleotide exchange factor GrpE [Candidatus Cloacimonetes bacterium]|jgi:molecular chaperone GrpE|nr:nucleotide exchange factor GrpE [Candidatus Cloacimonadota bacterium]